MEDNLIYILITAAAFILGWRIGSAVTGMIHRHLFAEMLKDLKISKADLINLIKKHGDDVPENIKAQIKKIEEDNDGLEVIEVKVEQHNDTLYMFRLDNDQFLGQGSNYETLVERLGESMKNVRLIVVEGKEFLAQKS